MSYRNAGIYNLTRFIRSILKRYRKEPPSLIMHLHSAGFRFGQVESPLHAYDGDLKHWLDCIREQKMPNELLDILDESGVKFYEGCLIVEVHDHRTIVQGDQQPPNEDLPVSQTSPHMINALAPTQPSGSKNETSNREALQDLPDDQATLHRLVLSPTCETLWKDLQIMNEARIAFSSGLKKEIKGSEYKWDPLTEEQAVTLEAAILERTTPALCLSPSIITSRIANQMLADTTLQPSTDHQKQRKRPLNSGEEEEMRRKRDRREKYMHIADESYGQPFAPSFSRVDLIKRLRDIPTIQLTKPPSEDQQPNPDPSLTPGLHSTVSNRDQPLSQSTTPEPRPCPALEAHPTSPTNNGLQRVNSHFQQPDPAPVDIIPPPSASPSAPVPPTAVPAKKTTVPKKKPAVINNLSGASEAGSPVSTSAKKLGKRAQARLEMTPEQLAEADAKKKKGIESRRLAKERKAAAAVAQSLGQTQQASPQQQYASNPTIGGHPQHRPSSAMGQDGNIPVPNRGDCIPVYTPNTPASQANQAGISVFNNHGMGVPSSSNQNMPALNHQQNNPMSTISINGGPNALVSTHNHNIPIPILNSNSLPVAKLDGSRMPTPMNHLNHSATGASKDMNSNNSNVRMDLNHSIPVPHAQHDIAVVANVMDQQTGIPVPQAHDHSNGIPVLQAPELSSWSMGMGGGGFQQPGYPSHPHTLPRDPNVAPVQNGGEMDIRVHQHQQSPPAHFNSNGVRYNPHNPPW